jgi:hypothetical protein
MNDLKKNTDTNKVFTTMLKTYKIINKESHGKTYYMGIKFKPEDLGIQFNPDECLINEVIEKRDVYQGD